MTRGTVRRLLDRPAVPVDLGLVAVGLVLTAFAVKTPWSPLPPPLVAGAGAASSAALWWRARRPVAVAVLGAAGYVLSGSPWALGVALLSGAAEVSAPLLPVLAVIGSAGLVAPEWIRGDAGAGRPAGDALLSAVTGTVIALVAGRYLRTRRELVASLRERAEHVEVERRLLEEQARADERTRIAREMHDVLAHKVALISLLAGGLEVNAAAAPTRVEEGAAQIRRTAQEALAELRHVLGLLRGPADPPDGTAEAFADVERLVATWTSAGTAVAFRDDVGPLPDRTRRAAYRLVQEGLTNAHKHAPGSTVTVELTGGPRDGVTVTVANCAAARGDTAPATTAPATTASATTVPASTGSGAGLVGLGERLRLLGGTVRAGADGAGGWRLEGRVPWLPGPAEEPGGQR